MYYLSSRRYLLPVENCKLIVEYLIHMSSFIVTFYSDILKLQPFYKELWKGLDSAKITIPTLQNKYEIKHPLDTVP